ncbi:MAG: hypothetical protein MUC80_04475 [Candidatus Thermoplasmatota archaeon]|jgi:hypothetical protein|nr:hypothetical protein [Candidatus Thermoplasmatota archaeon]
MTRGKAQGKICTTCHQFKPLSEFDKEKGYKDNIRPLCKGCKKKKQRQYAERWANQRSLDADTQKEKTCKGCQKTKSIQEFSRDKYHKDGRLHLCKDCIKQKNKEMRQRWKAHQALQQDPPQVKTCIHCNQTLPCSSFTKSINAKDGYENICKTCLRNRQQHYKIRWKKARQNNPLPYVEKICASCGQRLPISSFYIIEANKDGHSVYCKTCDLKKQEFYKQKWEQDRSTHPPRITVKTCALCKKILPITQFYPFRRYKDGYNGVCIHCEEKRHRQYMQRWTEERSRSGSSLHDKHCPVCERTLPLSYFHRNKRRKDGYTSLCKDCALDRENSYIRRWTIERQQKDAGESFTLFPSFEKTCSLCHRTLPISMFYRQIRAKDGVNSSCKECDLKRVKIYRLKHLKQPKHIPVEKQCVKCNRLLPATAFNRNSTRADGLDSHCKDCRKTVVQEYHSRLGVHEKMLIYQRAYSKRPEVRKKQRKWARKYEKRPDVKEKKAVYLKKYLARPEVKAHRKQYQQEYLKKKKEGSIATAA